MNFPIQIQDTTTNGVYEDVQIWYKHNLPINPQELFKNVAYVDYQRVPIYLLQSSVVDVYSNSDATQEYIRQKLVRHLASLKTLGLLFQSCVHDNIYIILFIQDMKVKGFLLDYTILGKIQDIGDDGDNSETNHIIDIKTRQNTVYAIDKVLEKKKRNKSTTPSAPVAPSTHKTPDQINSMVSKVILSGLRLRGLSTNSSISPSDKVRIKEIYSMTYKSTLFALRKFGSKSSSIKLTDVQDIVEKLLQIYVDIGGNSVNPFID